MSFIRVLMVAGGSALTLAAAPLALQGQSAQRLSVRDPAVFAFKIHHGGAVGRLALARVLGGAISEGAELRTERGSLIRLGALFGIQGEKTAKIARAAPGEVIAMAKADELAAGQWLSAGAIPPPVELPGTARNATIAIAPADRKDWLADRLAISDREGLLVTSTP